MISAYTYSPCVVQHNFPVIAEVISFVNQLTTLSRGPFGSDSTISGCLWQTLTQQQTFRTEQGSPMTYAMMKFPPEPMVSDTFLSMGIWTRSYDHEVLLSRFLRQRVCFWPYDSDVVISTHDLFPSRMASFVNKFLPPNNSEGLVSKLWITAGFCYYGIF